MRCKILLFFGLLLCSKSWSQNPATVFSIPNRNVNLACGTTCTSITATVPDIRQTDNYVVTTMPFLPFAWATPGGNELTSIYVDDKFSAVLPMGFPFCFYGSTYTDVVAGSNAILTFDLSNAGLTNSFPLDDGNGNGVPIPWAGGTQNSLFSTYYPKASIMGVYHDIYPVLDNGGARKIEWRVEGTAPNRRFIASYKDVPLFSDECNDLIHNSQMVLYESTGIIEVYVKDKPVCPTWNEGFAILGIQNFNRDQAVAAPGKNATVWGSANMNEAYRFTPSAGTPRFKRAELLVNNVVVGVGTANPGATGLLDLNFANVCPSQDSTAYVLRVTYGSCNDPAGEVSFTDTVFIKRPTPVISLVTQNATCANAGSITVNATGGSGFQYSLNGGTAQTGNVFNNLNAGIYTIGVSAGGAGCSVATQTTISLVNNLTVNALPTDTVICTGATFTPRVTSNATTFSWTPTSDITAATTLQPQIKVGNQNTRYIITATQGPCTVKDTINAVVLPAPQVNAGPDVTIVSGDVIQLQATGPAGTYLWTPSTGLSATNVLRPNASPTQTITYTLAVTNSQGCVGTDAVTINVLNCMQPMNAFTPNGDGINDFWLITNNGCFKTAKVEVFNRYGAKVFEDPAYGNNWNGTYKGKPLPDGTYYYIVTYQLINGNNVYVRGNVTILR